jgi:DNA-binding transcriptional MerR regulator
MSAAKKLANKLYANPLIENVNQEATGLIVNLLRKPIWQLGKKYRLITSQDKETIFGDDKHSGPSYIPSETFATTLLEELKIPSLTHKFTELKLRQFKNELLTDIKMYLFGLNIAEVKDALEQGNTPLQEPGASVLREYYEFEKKVNQVDKDFVEQKSTLEISIQRIQQRLREYSLTAKKWSLDDEYKNNFKDQIDFLLKDLFDDNECALLIARMKLSLTEIAKVFDKGSKEHQQILAEISNIDKEAFEQIKYLVDSLPKSVKESIFALAHRAQSKVDTVDKDINQLRKEIELWFDRSMERASGVYKRNAKGVAILIGLLIATVANADTFYMVGKLSTDRDIRNTITQNAEAVNRSCLNPTPTLTSTSTQEATSVSTLTSTTLTNNLDCVRAQTEAVLEKVSFPIGWSNNTLTDQLSLPDLN